MQDALRLENDELAKEIRQLRTAHSVRADSFYGRSFACTLWPSIARVPADCLAMLTRGRRLPALSQLGFRNPPSGTFA